MLLVLQTALNTGADAAKPEGSTGTIRLRPFASPSPAVGPASVFTDGSKWAAYESRTGVTRFLNTATGRSLNRANPSGCGGGGSGLAAVGSGLALYLCSNPECPEVRPICSIIPAENYATARYVVEAIVTGQQLPVAGADRLPSTSFYNLGGPGQLDAIGRDWASGEVRANHIDYAFYLNWHTGQLLHEGEEPPNAAGYIEDLDAPELLRPLCRPIRRIEDPNAAEDDRRFLTAEYEQPFLVSAGGEGAAMSLQRCGRDVRRLFAAAQPMQLGGGVLSWGGRYVTRLRSRASTWHGRIYRLTGFTGEIAVAHTATMVFATVGSLNKPEIYAARVP